MTRRDVIKSAVAAAAFRGGRAVAAESIGPTMTRLSAYMSEAQARALPPEVIEKAKHHILDTFAAIISGSQLQPGKVAIQFARSRGGEKVATVIGSNVVCGAIEAAFANGMLAHSDETDDYAPVGTHPGSAVLPAALAAGEPLGSGGMQFVRAVTLGYDIANRVAAALGGQLLNYDAHKSIHSVSGVFGAAAAAGSMMGLSAQKMRWMMDYAAQQASGIAAWQRDTEHIEKAFVFAGMPARDGLTAALLVESGATGVDDVLSGSDNFLLATTAKADAAKLTDKLGERYEIARTNIKKWTVGGPAQAALDALEILLKRRPFEAGQVQKLIVRLGPTMGSVVNNREMPDINVQHMLAVMLIDRTASFAAAHDKPRMQDPAVLKQKAKVQLIFDKDLEPDTEQRQAIVEVTLTGGEQLKEHVVHVRGTAENPMSRDEVVAKCRDLIAPVVGAAAAAKLIEKALDLENVKSLRELRPLLLLA